LSQSSRSEFGAQYTAILASIDIGPDLYLARWSNSQLSVWISVFAA
jgi:hypothetical protein